jgi:hypothetical protein
VSLVEVGVLFGASFVAGIINSIAGGGTLITFPTLIWLGRDPIIANATNTVSLWPGSLAAMLGLRRELRGLGWWMAVLSVPSLVGGLVGAILLLRTPTRVFAEMVPWLILFATALFALQAPIGRLTRRTATAPRREWWLTAVLYQLGVALYGGYFGAGIGIMTLAGLGLIGFTDIHQMIGLRNFYAIWINGIAAVYFVARGAVLWPDALVLTAGQVAGSYGGASLARRLGQRTIRRAVVVIGVAMALSLLLS